ncbi:DNA-binding transcriptional regulator [Loigolactobacillus backii]|uniref:sugar-binding transcriptional regulator n=1 Tax=Loigolactobacillus backii TaxID=375175 RepID=UPI0007F15923|nr:sugar-binding transcriptional regulator [Loigolactobacillus backii]ANK58898.1 DNA-binding transcriptional regulator [Loigolactobacillus backii]ANK63888.1 DNA-binding transcriptional regulator [Loigolactobacillus backii]ANK66335.1 DNA-binding transcriptional regulator [Loigolactobacillus backii]OLF69313.1 DeoR family transcriptional regulator [Loigolactobacillus backii]PIO84132.1 DNA-binding transcriptional regulator [Loigolactobacillus backii]
MDDNRRHLLAKVAYLYYIQGRTQSQIATELNIYRTTISRMLQQARQQHIVTIQIEDFNPQLFNLEEKLKQRFNLKNAIIVPSDRVANNQQKNAALSKAAALYLKQIIKPHDTVGFAWGLVLAGMVGQLQHPTQTDATFVPLVGGPSPSNSQYHVNGIVYDAARQFGGHSLFVDAAAVQESKLIRDGIIGAKYFYEIKRRWQQLDIAFVGIGGPLSSKSSRWRDLLTDQDRQLLKEREAIGDCCCTFFDRHGKILNGDLSDRTIAIPLPHLQRVPNTVGVARSLTKVPSITATLKMGLLNTLITDEETAKQIMDAQ